MVVGYNWALICAKFAEKERLIIWIIKLREGLPKFMRGFRDGLYQKFVDDTNICYIK